MRRELHFAYTFFKLLTIHGARLLNFLTSQFGVVFQCHELDTSVP